jgi:hypothetical protein
MDIAQALLQLTTELCFTSHIHLLRIVTFELNFYTFILHQLQLSVCYETFGPGSGDGGSSV